MTTENGGKQMPTFTNIGFTKSLPLQYHPRANQVPFPIATKPNPLKRSDVSYKMITKGNLKAGSAGIGVSSDNNEKLRKRNSSHHKENSLYVGPIKTPQNAYSDEADFRGEKFGSLNNENEILDGNIYSTTNFCGNKGKDQAKCKCNTGETALGDNRMKLCLLSFEAPSEVVTEFRIMISTFVNSPTVFIIVLLTSAMVYKII